MKQIILVCTPSWDSIEGLLTYFERVDFKWKKMSPQIPIVVGATGMGWGRGVHSLQTEGPQKKEGDKRSPAGLFALKEVFGRKAFPIKMPQVVIDEDLEFVDDPLSHYYNQFVRRSEVVCDWQSSEKMDRIGSLYERGIVVEHNRSPIIPGLGSAIFIHQWRAKGSPTVGCTGLLLKDLEDLIEWLDPKKSPHLCQLPSEPLFSILSSSEPQEEKVQHGLRQTLSLMGINSQFE